MMRSRNNTNPRTLRAMGFDPNQRRAALQAFLDDSKLKVFPWTQHAGLSEATVRGFLADRSRTLSDETYELLAEAASRLLQRPIKAAQLRGEPPTTIEIPLAHYVGAGDEVHLFDGNNFLDYVEAPPGFTKGAACVVKGDSMRPTFDDGDMLFYRQLEAPPKEPTRRAVIVQVKNGPLYVKKLLPGSRRGRFHLLSINPLTAVLTDQAVESIARIGWVKPVE